jgi:hypothetical protein
MLVHNKEEGSDNAGNACNAYNTANACIAYNACIGGNAPLPPRAYDILASVGNGVRVVAKLSDYAKLCEAGNTLKDAVQVNKNLDYLRKICLKEYSAGYVGVVRYGLFTNSTKFKYNLSVTTMKTFFTLNPIKFIGASSVLRSKGCSYSSLVLDPRKNFNIRSLAPPAIKNKTKIKIFTVPLIELTEFEFIKLLQLNLNLDTYYTILFQYTLYEQGTYLMLGPQVGIYMRETHDLKYYSLLYEHFLELLEILMDRYGVESPDFIVIYLKELILEETLKKDNPISQIVLSKGLVKVGDTKRLFSSSILPITYNEKYFGYLLQDKLKIEYLSKIIEKMQSSLGSELSSTGTRNSQTSGVLQLPDAGWSHSHSSSIKECVVPAGCYDKGLYYFFDNIDFNNLIAGLNIEQNQIIFMQKVISATATPRSQDTHPNSESKSDGSVLDTQSVVQRGYDLFKVYLSRDSKYLIFSIMSPDFVYYRIVFNNKSGKFLFVSKDILNPQLINKSNFLLNPAKT